MSYTKKAFYGFLWIAAGAFIANLFGYFIRLLLARKFTVEQYGLVFAVMAFFGLASIFKNFGLGEAVVKYTTAALVKKDYKKVKEYLVLSLEMLYASTLVVVIVVIILADWLAAVYFHDPTAALLIRIYSIGFLLSPFTQVVMSAFLGFQRMGLRAFLEASQSVVLFVATAALIALGVGIEAAMYSYIILYIFQYIVFIPSMLKIMPNFFKIKALYRKSTLKRLLIYGLPVMLTSVAAMVLSYTDTILITLLADLEQVGIYQTALPTANILLIVPGIFMSVMLPLIAELWERRKKNLITNALHDLYAYVVVAALPAIIAIVVFPGIIINLLFGSEYLLGAPILSVLAIASLFLILNSLNISVASGIGKPKMNTIAVSIGAVLNLLVNIALIPILGGLGAAISTLLSSAVILFASTYLLRKDLNISLPLWKWTKTFACGLIFWLVIQASRIFLVGVNQYLKVVIAVLIAAFVYAICILATRTITKDDLLDLKKRVFNK